MPSHVLSGFLQHSPPRCNRKILQKMVYIIGEILCYNEPLVADFERHCQKGGSYNS